MFVNMIAYAKQVNYLTYQIGHRRKTTNYQNNYASKRPSRSNKGSKTNDNYTKDSAYEIPTYTGLIPKLEKLSTSTALA